MRFIPKIITGQKNSDYFFFQGLYHWEKKSVMILRCHLIIDNTNTCLKGNIQLIVRHINAYNDKHIVHSLIYIS